MLSRCRQYGDPRLLEVTEERNGPSGLRDDDDDDDRHTPDSPGHTTSTTCDFGVAAPQSGTHSLLVFVIVCHHTH